MTFTDFIILLLVAGLSGAIGQALAGFSRGGCLTTIAVGLIGGLIGLWLARTFNLPDFIDIQIGGQTFPFVWAILGSAIFVAIISFLTKRRS